VVPGTEEFTGAFQVFWDRYHGPLRDFLRSEGHSADATKELLQGFLTGVVTGTLRGADPNEGRFRNYLLRSLINYVASDEKRGRALKRGGGVEHLPLESHPEADERPSFPEPATLESPARVYERKWALNVLDLALKRLEEGYRDRGDLETFKALSGHMAHDRSDEPYEVVARRLNRSEGTVKVQVTRLRERFRAELREVVAETVGDDDQVEAEIGFLFAALDREPHTL
jgi:RNA polymerase sigma-70 factor (ECF subfamily)